MSASSASSPTPAVKRDMRTRLLIVHGDRAHTKAVSDYLVRQTWKHPHGCDWVHIAYNGAAAVLASLLYPQHVTMLSLESPDHPIEAIGSVRHVLDGIQQLLESPLGRELLPRPVAGK